MWLLNIMNKPSNKNNLENRGSDKEYNIENWCLLLYVKPNLT